MAGFVKCIFEPCKCKNIIRWDPDKTLLHHYLRTKTRTELMSKAQQMGLTKNPYFETTWILAFKLAENSKVIMN